MRTADGSRGAPMCFMPCLWQLTWDPKNPKDWARTDFQIADSNRIPSWIFRDAFLGACAHPRSIRNTTSTLSRIKLWSWWLGAHLSTAPKSPVPMYYQIYQLLSDRLSVPFPLHSFTFWNCVVADRRCANRLLPYAALCVSLGWLFFLAAYFFWVTRRKECRTQTNAE